MPELPPEHPGFPVSPQPGALLPHTGLEFKSSTRQGIHQLSPQRRKKRTQTHIGGPQQRVMGSRKDLFVCKRRWK